MKDDSAVGAIILGITGLIILFFVCRELFCWYYKINERIALQKETNRLLRKLVGEPPINDQLKEQESVIFNK